ERAQQKTESLLRSLGYWVDQQVVDLSLIGAPQKRKRHVLIGSVSSKPSISSIVEAHRVGKERSVLWAVKDIGTENGRRLFTTAATLSKENYDRIDYLFDNKLYDLPNDLRPKCHQNETHSYRSMYGRLKPHEPAPTLTTGFHSPGQGRYIHPLKRR